MGAYKMPQRHPDRLSAISIALQHYEVPLEIAEFVL